MTAETQSISPYRGLRSYRLEDSELFFGRESDVLEIRALISLNRLSILHAPSGVGKSSLLQAGLTRSLEEEGGVLIICRPDKDPGLEVRRATLARLLPSPNAEAAAIGHIVQELAGATPSDRLASIQRRYRKQPLHERLGLSLTGHIERNAAFLPDGPPSTPLVSRYLALRNGNPHLAQYIQLLAVHCGLTFDNRAPDTRAKALQVLAETPVSELISALEAPELNTSHQRLLDRLRTMGDSLSEFFRVVDLYFSPEGGVHRVFLVIDQFEEFFTRFGDSDRSGVYDYRVRDRFFRDLAQVINVSPGEGEPLHVLFSLRDEYLGRLDDIEAFHDSTRARPRYRLSTLTPRSLQGVVAMPARAFGYGYDSDVIKAMSDVLVEEAKYVEPSQVQIVCTRIWEECGQTLFQQSRVDADEAGMEELNLHAFATKNLVVMDDINRLDGIESILDNHVKDFFAGLESELLQIEAFDMLARLDTGERRRKIELKENLISQPPRSPQHREELLRRLQDASIVRVERRRGGDQVEIVHERLLSPIHDAAEAARRLEPRWEVLGRALQRLSGGVGEFVHPWRPSLTDEQVDAVYWYREMLDNEEVTDWLADRMFLETTLSNSDASEGPDRLGYWAGKSKDRRHSGTLDGQDIGMLVKKGSFDDPDLITSDTLRELAELVDEAPLEMVLRSLFFDSDPEYFSKVLQEVKQ